MLKVTVNIDSVKKLEKHIELVKSLSDLKDNAVFQNYIQEKCLETVNKVANQRIYMFNTTNTDMRQEYLRNNKIAKFEDGFIIYNDTSIAVNNPSYENGRFSIALAFEYGVGIIGEANPVQGAWEYDVNGNLVFDDEGNYIRGWWLSKTKNGSNPYVKESKNGKAVITQGYQGMEIYRFSTEEIKSQLPKWIKDYLKQYGGVRQ